MAAGLRFIAKEEAARERIQVLLAGLRDLPWPGESRDWVERVPRSRGLFRKAALVRRTEEPAIPLGIFTWNRRSALDSVPVSSVPHTADYETGITAGGEIVLMDASQAGAGLHLAGGQDVLLSRALERAVGDLVEPPHLHGASTPDQASADEASADETPADKRLAGAAQLLRRSATAAVSP